jgi:uncharacterized damage-inducible protein DinB
MTDMADASPKRTLHRYLQVGREALLWKLDGVSEYDVRRPLVPTGTNLLGIVKHVASVELEYFTLVFGRPADVELPWMTEESAPNADMWATADESREQIIDLYHQSWALADATIDALDLDAPGHVPWWGDKGDTTLLHILVHMIAETHRHAGHADVLRETIDGAAGWRADSTNLPGVDTAWWSAHVAEIQESADRFRAP